MHDQPDHDHAIDAIESMPAAPEADQGTRDADAPTWSAPTEGHEALPLTPPAATAEADEGGAGEDDAAGAGGASDRAAGEPGIVVSGERVEVRQTGAQRIDGREVSVFQGGAAIISGERVRVEQGGAFAIVGRRITLRDSGAFILLARRTDGQVNVAFDWRAIAAIVTGILAIMVVRGRR